MIKIVRLIYTEDGRWTWNQGDPIRRVKQLYTEDWMLVCSEKTEWDAWIDNLDAIRL